MKASTCLLLLFCTFLSVSCSSRMLSVRTTYFTEENLASYRVQTPDPDLYKPMIEQRLIFTWSLPKKTCLQDTHLNIKIRFKNYKEENLRIKVHDKNGYYIYKVNEEKLRDSGGILTYKGEILIGEKLLETWYHPLWVELITFPDYPLGS